MSKNGFGLGGMRVVQDPTVQHVLELEKNPLGVRLDPDIDYFPKPAGHLGLYKLRIIGTSIQTFIFYAADLILWVAGKLESIPADFRQELGHTLGSAPINCRLTQGVFELWNKTHTGKAPGRPRDQTQPLLTVK